MSKIIDTLEKRINDLENRSRRWNLIVYGIEEVEGGNRETLEKAVNEGIIQETLRLDPVAIE